MRNISLASAAEIYICSGTRKLITRRLYHNNLRDFCLLLERCRKRVANIAAEDSYWDPFLLPLFRYRLYLCAAPVPFNHSGIQPSGGFEALQGHLEQAKSVYPQIVPMASALLDHAKALSVLEGNPALEFLKSDMPEVPGERIGMLARRSRMIPVIEDSLSGYPGLRGIEVVGPSQLQGGSCYSKLVVIGAVQWYPEFIFTSPRAREIHVLRYTWIKDNLTFAPLFSFAKSHENGQSAAKEVDAEVEDASLSASEMLPAVDMERLSNSLASVAVEDRAAFEDIDARLFVLEGSNAVFFAKGASALVIDLDEDGTARVRRIAEDGIQPGVFILLRTEGGGDFIVPVADRILDMEAKRVREIQRLWKARLRDMVKNSSLLEVAIKLLDLGSLRANEANVRNWMSERSIKTEDLQDFSAIMKCIGLGDKIREYWEAMSVIDRAHRKAGTHIRRLLLKRVNACDLKQLERTGRMEFELPDAAGGSLTALRVEKVSEKTYKVPESREGRLLEVPESLWQG